MFIPSVQPKQMYQRQNQMLQKSETEGAAVEVETVFVQIELQVFGDEP